MNDPHTDRPADAQPQGRRILGFGKHPETAAALQARLRSTGLRARNFALTNDADGDAQLERHLTESRWDGVAIGSYISGQDPSEPPTAETTEWFTRILNIVHRHAPTARIILIRHPTTVLADIENVLGAPGPGGAGDPPRPPAGRAS